MVKEKAIWIYAVALAIGLVAGYKVIPTALIAIAYITIAIMCVVYAAQNKLDKLFTYLPFIAYTEIYIRAFVRTVPYLTMQYVFIIVFSLLLINGTGKKIPHTQIFYFLVGFSLVETLNSFFPDNPKLLRAIYCNSTSLLITVIWASFNRLSPAMINKILASVKIAAVFLTGAVMVAHLQGNINYGHASSNEASNGMAPVQLSGYLGFASILFFIAIMNPQELSTRILNMVVFALVTVIMVLTFSRGGLYFLAIVSALYLFFNRAKMGSYFKFLLIIPIALILYNIVIEQTGGAILDRYEAKGSSNRDVLVEVGVKVFLDNPITGVGTSNFGSVIVKKGYFSVESTAHNEFVRAAAEEGILGFLFYWGFFIGLFFIIIKRPTPNREFSIYFFVLFCLILVHNGLKISIQPLILLLAIANPGTKNFTHQIFNGKRKIQQPIAIKQPA